ncbi:hypothetical protein MED134_01095 [Dokdonia sp. MED134]|uniref:hypothetical protein n=1 Tax=Dokdonia sp. MED134 TaxID=313590 RepID=UPI0000689F4D|nr:hypothetical protein [Dokdonia sp. MED134]EAQ39172.3 hypothetical protein MED134_01095 [Dokdonia sp. MED134]
MKAIYALILFSIFALRPVMNVGNVLYYELNIDYIVETYCVNKDKPKLQCNGKCYLSKQLSLDTSDSSNENLSIRIVEAFYPLYFQSEQSFTITSLVSSYTQNSYPLIEGKVASYQSDIDWPPQLSV